MKVIRLSTDNVAVSIYPEVVDGKEFVVLQIDKKRTQDKIHIDKQKWSELTVKVFETCFSEESKALTEALNKVAE
jgi:Holliday junction resolvase